MIQFEIGGTVVDTNMNAGIKNGNLYISFVQRLMSLTVVSGRYVKI